MTKRKKNGSESNPKNSQEVKTNELVLLPEIEIFKKIESLKPRHLQIFKRLVEHFSYDEFNHSDFYGEDQLWKIVELQKDDVSIEDYISDLVSQKLLFCDMLEGEEDEPDVVYVFFIEDLEMYDEMLRNFPIPHEFQELNRTS